MAIIYEGISDDMIEIIKQRDIERQKKNYTKADELRKILFASNIKVQDYKDGESMYYKGLSKWAY